MLLTSSCIFSCASMTHFIFRWWTPPPPKCKAARLSKCTLMNISSSCLFISLSVFSHLRPYFSAHFGHSLSICVSSCLAIIVSAKHRDSPLALKAGRWGRPGTWANGRSNSACRAVAGQHRLNRYWWCCVVVFGVGGGRVVFVIAGGAAQHVGGVYQPHQLAVHSHTKQTELCCAKQTSKCTKKRGKKKCMYRNGSNKKKKNRRNELFSHGTRFAGQRRAVQRAPRGEQEKEDYWGNSSQQKTVTSAVHCGAARYKFVLNARINLIKRFLHILRLLPFTHNWSVCMSWHRSL